MEKLILALVPLIFFSLLVHGQNNYEPQILILAPNDFSFEPSLQKEVDSINREFKKMTAAGGSSLFGTAEQVKDLAPNLKLKQQNEASFLGQMEISKELTFISQEHLLYTFYEKFPNCLVLQSKEKSAGGLEDLHRIASEQKHPYILNFSKVRLYTENTIKYCKMQVQLYELQSNSLLIDKEYKGDWNNPGFEFSCRQGSIECTIHNALSVALGDVVAQVAQHNQTLIKEHELAKMRASYIANTVYPQPSDDSLIRTVTSPADSDINLKDIYHCFHSADKTKFVAFFIKNAGKDAGSILTQKKDQNVHIITKKDIKDPGYFDQSESTYAYIVRGLLFQNKWYIEKTDVTYFDAKNLDQGKMQYLNNLQDWGFFAEGTAEPSNEFWEGKLFEKIKDKRLDPDWEKYKDMWAGDERENRPYIGLYEIVANQLKKENELSDQAFRKQIITKSLSPLYETRAKLKLNHIIKFDEPENNDLIYPADKRVVLNPVRITDEKGITRIRYFVLLPATSELFEWTLVPQNLVRKKNYNDNELIIKTLSNFTPWDYSYKTLDDDLFWNKKVLLREDDKYKYLTKIQ